MRNLPLIKGLRADARVSPLPKPQALDKWNAGIRAAQIGENVITIYDVIGDDFWTGGGVTVNRIDAALRKIGARDVEVHVNSPGGDMFEGIAIYNRLREHGHKVTVKVMGLAASAASVIAMAGDEIEIGAASFIMIHNAWVLDVGNRHDKRAVADMLEPFDAAMADLYVARTGIERAEIDRMMDAETFMSGSQAVEKGFADRLLAADYIDEDEDERDRAKGTNALRRTEIALCREMTRSQARALINEIRGTPGAASPATPGAGDLTASLRALSQTLRS